MLPNSEYRDFWKASSSPNGKNIYFLHHLKPQLARLLLGLSSKQHQTQLAIVNINNQVVSYLLEQSA